MTQTQLDYYSLPSDVRLHLHAVELHACIVTARTMMPASETLTWIKRRLNDPSNPNRWSEQLDNFCKPRMQASVKKENLILYYLVAGCGINKIQKLLNVGQATVYRVRDTEDWSKYRTVLSGMFQTDPHMLQRLQVMVNGLNTLDGLRILDPNHIHELYTDTVDSKSTYTTELYMETSEVDTERAEEEKRQRIRAMMLEED